MKHTCSLVPPSVSGSDQARSSDSETWSSLLRRLAARRPDAVAYTVLPSGDGDGAGIKLTFGELDSRARGIASRLHEHGERGERALLLYPPGLDYVSAFFGCLYAGIVAVPAYPPDRARVARTLPRIKAIASDAKATLLLTTSAVAASGALDVARLELGGLAQVTTDATSDEDAARWLPGEESPDDVALLQYTSGSTASPSGVVLTHRNMLHNAGIQRRAWNLSEATVGVSWLPLYHDLGVISCLLQPVFVGFHTVLLSPTDFIQRPLRWLEAIARFRGTFAGGPNFAFDLCVRGTTAEDRARLDLGAWETAFNGAEPIRPESLDRFAEAFAVSGFRRTALYPCYGLAEANFVTGMRPGAGPKLGRFDASGLERGEAVDARGGAKSRTLVSCGEVPPEQTLAIVDPQSREVCPPGRVGEVWLAGGSVGRGYWGRPEATAATFEATCAAFGDTRFLRTGDLGFMDGGQLYLTGRLKDLIIIRGANHYPQDIERTVERSHPAMRAGCGAAFAVEEDGVERVVVVHEVQGGAGLDLAAALESARGAVLREHEIAAFAIVLLRAGAIAKTTSGKIQRRACKAAFLEGTLEPLGEWRQGGDSNTASSPSPAQKPQAFPQVSGGTEKPDSPARSALEIEGWLVTSLSRLLKTDPRHLDPREPFASYGLDSLAATELTGALETWLGRRVEPTAAYEHPTIEALARHLATGAPPLSWTPPKAGRPERTRPDEPIAIIGIGCRFPGGDSPSAFWSLLRNGGDAVTEVPPSRWDAARLYDADPSKPGKMNSRWGGFLAEVDRFDPLFFGISPREARQMDPQQRLLLEVAWEALEDAGQVPAELRGSATGVFLGMTTEDYGRMQWNGAALDMYSATGTLDAVAAGRLSYAFDFRGPSLALDTACSSSLVAIHYACQSLWTGEATLALAGGVNVILAPENGISLAKLGALSADGRCKAFDDRADGFVRGEGAGLVVLKRLSAAIADGDRIYAVIRGSAVNQDGRSNGLTAPNPQAQRAVLRDAYRHAGVSPGTVQYVEAHGTGTRLGDPMELRALGRVLATDRHEGDLCAVGSVKTNIGHLESAAGVAGLIKTALALHHEAIPPSLHFQRANPLIPFDQLPVRVQDHLAAWPRGRKPRYAGVSAFGIGGTNAHVVVEEAPAPSLAVQPEPDLYALPISARSGDALFAMARAYRESLRSGPLAGGSLGDICYSASVRRGHLEHRLCVVGESRLELLARLDAFLGGEPSPVSLTEAGALAARYERGEEVDFRPLYAGRRPLVTLPSYAWQRSRHWLENSIRARSPEAGEARGQVPTGAPPCSRLGQGHPLLERHIESASGELLWEVDLRPDTHGFLEDHVLGASRVLAGLAYVEMALAAAAQALGEGPFAATEIELVLALFLPDAGGQVLQLSLRPDPAREGAAFRIHSRSRENAKEPWKLHATGKIVREPAPTTLTLALTPEAGEHHTPPTGTEILARCPETRSGDAFYEMLRATGTNYGPRFRGVTRIARRDGEALGEIQVPPSLEPELGSYLFHPALLDACAQVLLATEAAVHPFMPVRIDRIRLYGRPGGALQSHAEATAARPGEETSEGTLRGSVRVYREGTLVAEIIGARLQLLDRTCRPSGRPLIPETYEQVWKKRGLSVRPLAPPTSATWLLLSDRQGVADALATRLAERGDRCVLLASGALAEGEAIRSALATARVGNGPPLRAVVHLRTLDEASQPSRLAADDDGDFGCGSLVALSRQLLALPDPPRIWAVTRGAQSVGDGSSSVSADQAPLWGLARSLSVECARVWGGIVDLDRGETSADEHARAIEQAIDGSEEGENQIAIRGEEQYVPRIVRRSQPPPQAPFVLRPDGAYVITGGLGGLGLKAAAWMVAQGARRLLLIGRTPLPPRARWNGDEARGEVGARVAAIRALEEAGAEVAIAAADVADEASLAKALEEFGHGRGTMIRGVIHAAGVGRLCPVSELTLAGLRDDLRAKVAGGRNLDRLLEDAPLDFFILYSSLSALLPSPLLAAYAASNAFLEALARNRTARGKPGLCIHWGMWSEVGMAARAQKARGDRDQAWKVGTLTPDEALGLQQRLLDERAVVAIATRTDWSALAVETPALGRLPLLSSLRENESAPRADAPPPASASGKVDRASLLALSPDAQLDLLATYLKGEIEEVLALDPNSFDQRDPLDAVGYDSLTAVDLQIRIGKRLDIDVPLLSLLQRGSARDLALRIAPQLKPSTGLATEAHALPPAAAGAPPPRAAATGAERPVHGRELSASLSMYSARTPTLPPATHTNSYGLGGRDVVLVEPATPFEEEQRAWIEWARGLAASGRRAIAIFATHHHDDHVGGLDVLARELALPLWMHRETWERVRGRVAGAAPARFLEDGETINLAGPTPEEWRVLHTPGHAPGHVCLWNPSSRTIVAGDMVASVGTILIAPGDGDMRSYLAQLDRLAQLDADWALPAHGEPIAKPTALFRRYIEERETREREVLGAIAEIGARGGTPENIVPLAYSDTPPHTWPVGLLSLRSHLEKLLREGRVIENDGVYRSCG